MLITSYKIVVFMQTETAIQDSTRPLCRYFWNDQNGPSKMGHLFTIPKIQKEILRKLSVVSIKSLCRTSKELYNGTATNVFSQCKIICAFCIQMSSRISDNISEYKILRDIAQVYSQVDDRIEMEKVLKEKRATALQKMDEDARFQVYMDIVRFQDEIGNRNQAKEILKIVKEITFLRKEAAVRARSFIAIAQTQSQIDDKDEVRSTLQEVENIISLMARDPSFQSMQARLKIQIAQVQHAIGNTVEAKRTLLIARTITQSAHLDGIQEVIAVVQAQIGDINAAKITVDQLGAIEHRSRTLVTIAQIEMQNEKAAEAKETLLNAKTAALSIQNLFSRCKMFISIAQAQNKNAARKTLKLTKNTASLIEDDFEKSLIFKNIVSVRVQIGDMNEAKTIVPLIINNRHISEALKTIALAQSDQDKARGMLKEAKKFISFNSELRALARTQLQIGDIEGAKETILQTTKGHLKNSFLFIAIAQQQMKQDNWEGANKTLLEAEDAALFIRSTYGLYKVLIALYQERIKQKDWDEANRILVRVKKAVLSIQNRYYLSKAYITIALRGNRDKAEQMLNKAREEAIRIKDTKKRSKRLMAIVRAQIQIGAIVEAKTTALSITPILSKVTVMLEIAQGILG